MMMSSIPPNNRIIPTVPDVSQGKDAPAVAASVPQTVIADRRAGATAT